MVGLFMLYARERNLVRDENRVESFQRIFRHGLHCMKNRELTGVSLVCLKQLTGSTLVRRYVGRTKFWFKIN